MKKKFFKSTLAVVLVAAAAFGGARTYGAYSATAESNLLAENIEALSDETGEPQAQRCTMAKDGCSGPCYVGNLGNFVGMWVDEVEEYYVYEGSPIICYHIDVRDCPPGSHRLN